MGGDDRVVVLVPETHRHAPLVLILTAAGHDGVDVHGVDLTGETCPRSGIRGGAFAQMDQHHRIRAVRVRAVDDTRWALRET